VIRSNDNQNTRQR
jgi:hypothetical protein